MTYKLAKELQEAGFPQGKCDSDLYYVKFPYFSIPMTLTFYQARRSYVPRCMLTYKPSLDNLMLEVGDDVNKCYENLAKLWLSISKK